MDEFTLQFHVTESCMYRCSHCYLGEDRKAHNILSIDDAKKIIDKYLVFIDKLSIYLNRRVSPIIHLTGGDPLLRKDIYDIISYCTVKGIKVGILGNPDLLTSKVCERLNSLGVRSYQISLDGLEDFHDSFRGKEGSFKKSLEALELLTNSGIYKTYVMCNVSNYNIGQVIPLYEYLLDYPVYAFNISRVSTIGSASCLDVDIDKLRYRDLLKGLFEVSNGSSRLQFKDPLWSLLNYEMGLIKNTDNISGGCQAGINILVTMPDGSCYACRRLNICIGNINELSFMDMYISNTHMRGLRSFSSYKGCSSCKLVNICRGCPAISYNSSGDLHGIDPQCWNLVK